MGQDARARPVERGTVAAGRPDHPEKHRRADPANRRPARYVERGEWADAPRRAGRGSPSCHRRGGGCRPSRCGRKGHRAPGDHRIAGGTRERGPGPAPAGDVESPEQRYQVHAQERESPGQGSARELARRDHGQRHGGSVFAESPGEGQGAMFVVKLPLMITEVRQEPIAHRAESALTDLSLSGVRVKIVDNDPAAVDLIAEVLSRAGGDVRGCGSAEIALNLLGQWRPDILVSDIEMPGVDGYTLIRKVRALSPE